MEKELKPCPFCGSVKLKLAKKRTIYRGHKAYVASIRCNRCNARGGTVLNLTIPYAVKEDVENEAARRWNRRANSEEDN
ncbi:MAG: Lar family restriction alleviation protein [Ruminococcus sp.]|nr:Lar family restriction alleviation protein [Ruminococcus sp.]